MSKKELNAAADLAANRAAERHGYRYEDYYEGYTEGSQSKDSEIKILRDAVEATDKWIQMAKLWQNNENVNVSELIKASDIMELLNRRALQQTGTKNE